MIPSFKNRRGFTLIELLVVIAIISLLSSTIMASLGSARTKSYYGKANVEISEFIKASVIAQGESNRRLQDITLSSCSDCACRGIDIRNIADTHACYTQWITALTRIQNATGGSVSGLTRMARDAWGSPYALDENEREAGPTYCVQDTIRSVGPDGMHGSIDDVSYVVPFSRACP